ncbi:MAG: hypothetical protein RBQ72_00150 [Desulfobacterium sp.]|jgi:hypothetical protein|nr:hypothetical protein [Desulfobacterium sp.]
MNPKKMAAVTAAVVTYIKSQEEAARFAAPLETFMDDALKSKDPGACSSVKTWAMAGRSDQMQGRTMMQMRVFKQTIRRVQ